MATLRVKATTTDRQVIISEYDEAHPGPTHEVYIAGYPDTIDDSGNVVVGNVEITVGDTALVRQKIADGLLVEVSKAKQAEQTAAPSAPDERKR